MKSLLEAIQAFKQSFEQALHDVTSDEQLEQVRVAYLGRQGSLTEIMQQLKSLSIDDKRIAGPALNELKHWAHQTYETYKQQRMHNAQQHKEQKAHYFDVTAYQAPKTTGSLHIYTQVINQLTTIFSSMGFAIVDGPEVETDFYNFQALNIPADHPARDMQDTFWIAYPELLLRTHTSSVQTHSMQSQEPPFAICAPGRVYRNEETDASHDFMFMQAEALLVSKDISMANLLATARTFLQHLFEQDNLNIRVRPGYFPFVEPGVEIDASCPFCTTGCQTCKYSRWIEILGAGLVHPNVLKASNIDTNIYSGFAFGCGIERIAMIKYGINDIRLFHSNKVGFLNQFS